MGYKKVSTTLESDVVKTIKEKGYKYSELIKIGLKAKEMQDSYEGFLLKIAERFEKIAEIQQKTTEEIGVQIKELKGVAQDMKILINKMDILITSFNSSMKQFEKLLEQQQKFFETVENKFDRLLGRIEELVEWRNMDLEKRLSNLANKLNLSFKVINELLPEDRAKKVIKAIVESESEEEVLKIIKI